VSTKVFDVLGREVRTLVRESKSRGVYEKMFNATGLAGGVYFYQFVAISVSHPESHCEGTRAVVLLK
jgi:hypothetical protein